MSEEVKEEIKEEETVKADAPVEKVKEEAKAEDTAKADAPVEKVKEEAKAEDTAKADAPVEKVKEEAKAEDTAKADAPAEEKIKKINRLSLDGLNAKIKDLEESNNIQSRYYRHLIQRQKELVVVPPAAE